MSDIQIPFKYQSFQPFKYGQVRYSDRHYILSIMFSGKVISGWKVSEGSEWTLIGKKSPQLPQMFYPVEDKELTIKKGDIIAARCTMVSPDTNKPGYGIVPLRAKRVGEFIEIRHKKNSPTCILSTLGCL